jgi:steroid Delta-isomerase
MPTREEIVATVEAYVGAVGRQDLEATLACFAEDARQEDPVGTPANVGTDAIREFFQRAYKAPFTTHLDGPVLVTGDYAAFHFRIEVPTTGDPIEVRVADLAHFDSEAHIADLRAVVD